MLMNALFTITGLKAIQNVKTLTKLHCFCLIYRCAISDTAMYTAVASNSHGQASSQSSIIVKSESSNENF